MLTNILEYLEGSALRYPEKISYADENRQLTYSQLKASAERAGSGIAAVLKNPYGNLPVMIFMKKSPDVIAAFMSVLMSGNFYVPIDVEMPVHRVALIIENLKPALIICDSDTVGEMETAANGQVPVRTFDSLDENAPDPEGLEKIKWAAFVTTGISTLTIPQSVEDLSVSFLAYSADGYQKTPLIKLYCASELEKVCQDSIAYRNGMADVVGYQKKGGLYEVDGVSYRGIGQLQNGIPVKRIYTVNEATQASGKKNSVMIRYK